ncbi:MAG: prepilin-type N-terminal cleavage/methylation domain-containing protein [Lachnospiraceae bacterium]|nr:prepilin-type N-terminal cleavage/methylation domain-containing protein [Lachnospiraceae bacterium]
MTKRLNDKGYTLVELIVVIAIMAVLVGVITPNLMGFIDKAKKSNDLEMARVLGEALERVLILDDAAATEWNKIGQSGQNSVYFDVTDPYTGESYRVYNGFEWTLTRQGDIQGRYAGNYRNGVLRDPYGVNAHRTLYNAYIQEIGQKDINISYRKYYINQYRILKRADNGMPEVWVCPVKAGTDGEGINNGFVYYRLYPNYDENYLINKEPGAINANGRNNTL